MPNEWSNPQDRAEDSDKFTAATLAAAMVTSGQIALPASVEKAARQAIEIYRVLLAELRAMDERRDE